MYYRRGEIDPSAPPPAFAARAINRVTPLDRGAHRTTLRRLAGLLREHPEVTVFSAHDAAEFTAIASPSAKL
ncbi:hypothetical protein KZZ52_18780 [Dactylosporangium sp. AC04546]|uniref:hypothetical protein n=1 Tax=Dactylosporangium sp. AC04546 TaxID=2862460 RepID=UPI001EDCFC4D|nr:hypothetical protein [Dactylosporangium sp. AC04546]WVK87349.1 hypothetical protein KZZ52_18780 [Dactylosporangium sp. AC04546]